MAALRLDKPMVSVGRSLMDVAVPGILVLGGALGVAAVGAGLGAAAYAGIQVIGGGEEEWAKRAVGRLRAVGESCRLAWGDFWGSDDLTVLPDTWAPCILEDREEFGETDEGGAAYVAYRFQLKSGDGAVLPLELGQEVTFAGLDDRNRPVRASFPLANSRREPGVVEIVAPAAGARRDLRVALGGFSEEQRALADALDRLPARGEAAVRPGRAAFRYEGAYLPVTSLHCFCEEAGALPVLSLLAESLPRGRSTVESAKVFWVNGAEDDFGLYDALEGLYYKYAKKLELACVVDAELHADAHPAGEPRTVKKRAQDLLFQRNEDLAASVDVWQPGMLAVVAGPAHFAEQVAAHLIVAKGYPAECVVYF